MNQDVRIIEPRALWSFFRYPHHTHMAGSVFQETSRGSRRPRPTISRGGALVEEQTAGGLAENKRIVKQHARQKAVDEIDQLCGEISEKIDQLIAEK